MKKPDIRIEGLVMRASTVPGTDFKEISQMLSESIDKGIDNYHIYKHLYKHIYKNHLNTAECEKLIETFNEKPWTLEETNLVARKLDYDFAKKPYTQEEFRVAMYILKEELDSPLKDSNIAIDSTTYGRLADKYLSTNEGTCKLIREYFHRIMR